MDYRRTAIKKYNQKDFSVERLGECKYDSPIPIKCYEVERKEERVLFNTRFPYDHKIAKSHLLSFELARPHKKIYFDSTNINVGIVTCGGLCPGLNDVIRSITYACLSGYGVKNVYGFRYGYQGLTSEFNQTAIRLDETNVAKIHQLGGTMLGSSRGSQDIVDMVDTLVKFNISILYTIGGDGTHHGTTAIVKEIQKRNLKISVIGVPKTIDNDVAFVEKTFGFETAVEQARHAIKAAHVEAKGSLNGIGLVKLMGRHSGFIAAHATLASGDVNLCLIPEDETPLETILEKVKKRFTTQGKDHIVIVVAEGFGQKILTEGKKKKYDASGNVRLEDIGPFLKEKIGTFLKKENIKHTIKYIDPSYTIRSTAANASDSSFCLRLGNYAVHAGMSGRTNCLVGHWGTNFTLVPIHLTLSTRKVIDIDGPTWRCVKEITI
jgi:6-phosphofructokinase 1